MTNRKCKNWLHSFLDWTLPRMESPESYLLFSGLFCLSSALRRKVFVEKAYLGGWECFPHMYTILVGPAGEVRKTTAMYQAIHLLSHIPVAMKGPNIVTQAALLAKLVESDDNAVYLTSKELSDLIMKSGPEMYEFLTTMFDGDKTFESATISRGVEFVQSPCLNLIAATTPQWIATGMPEQVIGGGFASRCLFLYEDKPRFKKLFFKDVVYPLELKQLEQDLIDDLKHISMNLAGPFSIPNDVIEFCEHWYNTIKIPAGSKLAGYYARKHTHMIKLAMLLHISYSDELTLTLQDIKDAILILEKMEVRLPKVFEGVGKNPYTLNMQSVVDFITDNKKVERSHLLRTFDSIAEPLKLDELLTGLINAKRVEAFEEGGVINYYPKSPKG